MFATKLLRLWIKMTVTIAVAFAGFGTCERENAVSSPTVTHPRTATLYYAPGETDPPQDMLDELDQVAARVWSDLSVRILVLASANEGRDFDENLTLAEARARTVWRQLIAHGVPERQIIVAAREAPLDDPMGARCEVEPLSAAQGPSPVAIE